MEKQPEKQLRDLEGIVERSLDKVTSHPAFLTTVSGVINFNSYRKIWAKKALETLWRDLELPIKGDQERILSSLQELEIRLQKMQNELTDLSDHQSKKESTHSHASANRLKIVEKRKSRQI